MARACGTPNSVARRCSGPPSFVVHPTAWRGAAPTPQEGGQALAHPDAMRVGLRFTGACVSRPSAPQRHSRAASTPGGVCLRTERAAPAACTPRGVGLRTERAAPAAAAHLPSTRGHSEARPGRQAVACQPAGLAHALKLCSTQAPGGTQGEARCWRCMLLASRNRQLWHSRTCTMHLPRLAQLLCIPIGAPPPQCPRADEPASQLVGSAPHARRA